MKREAILHTKMKRLCRKLNIPLWQAVGILESIWHITGRQAPRGDIGRLSDEEISIGIEYYEDETTLIDALVESRWIDRHLEHRLVIHDWPEHCDIHVHAKLAKITELFWDHTAPKLPHDLFNGGTRTRIKSEYRTRWGIEIKDETKRAHADGDPNEQIGDLFDTQNNINEFSSKPPTSPDLSGTNQEKSRTCPDLSGTNQEKSRTSRGQTGKSPGQVRAIPEPVTSSIEVFPNTHTQRARVLASDLNGHTSSRFDEFWERYPRKVGKNEACQAFISVVSTEVEGQLFACLDRYRASDQVKRNVVMNPAKWLFEQHRDNWENIWPVAEGVNGSASGSGEYVMPKGALGPKEIQRLKEERARKVAG